MAAADFDDNGAYDVINVNVGGANTSLAVSTRMDVPLRGDGLSTAQWRLTDLLGPEMHERNGAELVQPGLYLDLPPHGAQLFHCQRIPPAER